jgi:nucleoid DNA-binding protein
MDTREIITRLSGRLGRDEAGTERIVAAISAELGDQLVARGGVALPGFGSFRAAPERRQSVLFRPVRALKDALWRWRRG